MTIRKGVAWGGPGPLSETAPVYADDASAATWLQSALDDGAPVEVGLIGGDLHRTLGAPRHDEADLRAGRGMRFPVDLGVVEFEDPGTGPRRIVFLAHLVACTDPRARWWKGRTVVAMNAAFVGAANLGPRAHPDDGRLDITDGELSWGDRRRAATRAPLGAHVPHPGLEERRIRELVVDADAPMRLRLDGRDVTTTTRFELRCLPDAATIVV